MHLLAFFFQKVVLNSHITFFKWHDSFPFPSILTYKNTLKDAVGSKSTKTGMQGMKHGGALNSAFWARYHQVPPPRLGESAIPEAQRQKWRSCHDEQVMQIGRSRRRPATIMQRTRQTRSCRGRPLHYCRHTVHSARLGLGSTRRGDGNKRIMENERTVRARVGLLEKCRSKFVIFARYALERVMMVIWR